MVRIMLLIALAVLVGTDCSEDQNPVSQYGKNLTGAVKKAEKTKVTADLLTIKTEIIRYKAEHGSFPPSLEALNLKDIYPHLYTYDPETGAVAVAR